MAIERLRDYLRVGARHMYKRDEARRAILRGSREVY